MTTTFALADRGVFRRKKSKISFNINLHNFLRSSIFYNLRESGLTFKGSKLVNEQMIGNNLYENNLIYYKKGNTVYLLPVKNKIVIPQYSPTSGYKIVIRP